MDRVDNHARVLLLGSASPALGRGVSEPLAGRVRVALEDLGLVRSAWVRAPRAVISTSSPALGSTKPIRNEAEYDLALAEVDRLMGAAADSPARQKCCTAGAL